MKTESGCWEADSTRSCKVVYKRKTALFENLITDQDSGSVAGIAVVDKLLFAGKKLVDGEMAVR